MPLEELDWWWDPVARSGPLAMAVDEWLLETAVRPLLRVYAWDGNWASVGYFGDLEAAREAIPNRSWVRRKTGGGVVDHTIDWTYTLVVPRGYSLSQMRGGDSYLAIHREVVSVLREEGVAATLSEEAGDADQALCFRNPVPHDVLSAGLKVAGAGQRRSRNVLLHQGSVVGRLDAAASARRTKSLAMYLGKSANKVELRPPDDFVHDRAPAYVVG